MLFDKNIGVMWGLDEGLVASNYIYLRRAIKVDHVDTSAELIPIPEPNSYHNRLHDEIMRGL